VGVDIGKQIVKGLVQNKGTETIEGEQHDIFTDKL